MTPTEKPSPAAPAAGRAPDRRANATPIAVDTTDIDANPTTAAHVRTATAAITTASTILDGQIA